MKEEEAKREREKSEASAAQVTFNVDATNAEAKKEEERVKEAEKLRKKLEEAKERLEEEDNFSACRLFFQPPKTLGHAFGVARKNTLFLLKFTEPFKREF